ncbi:MAG: alpha/beta hydrolase [Chloroflexota bacterium]|nr:alpha/beta hydrolase [Chloroflexota bacterium]
MSGQWCAVSRESTGGLIDQGSGPTLLVFHGWNGSSHNVLRWLPALAPRFRVIVPDLPGCNATRPLAERHTAAAYARFGAELLDSLGIERAAIGGLCSGTAIAVALADAHPERVSALLLHTPFVRPGLIRPLVRAQLIALASPAGALFGPLRRSTTLATLHRRLFANAAEVEPEQLAHDQSDLLGADVRAGRELAADLLRVDRTAALRASRVPLAVLIAEHDSFVDAPATVAAIHEISSAAAIRTIEGGHGWTPAYIERQTTALKVLGAHLAGAMA